MAYSRAVTKKTVIGSIALLFLLLLAVLYKKYNPLESAFFPACPFRSLTGLLCPGCGSQRAIHQLLNFNIAAAFHENMLLVIAIPYLIVGWIIELIPHPDALLLAWRKALYGPRAIIIILFVIIAYWILRNIL
ncbi:MAG: DUF2752 domain-containing protein [Bacteroidales bacterium]|nr:DUF2752 domain-containing protein [Bacteroidales bacterium]